MIPIAPNPNGTEVFLCKWPANVVRKNWKERDFVFSVQPKRYDYSKGYGSNAQVVLPISQIDYGMQIFEADIRFEKTFYSNIFFEVKGLPSTMRLELALKEFINLFKRLQIGKILTDSDGWMKVCLTSKKRYYGGQWILCDDPRLP